ncbi:MAG: cytidine deaminase [Devosiaceae bacterium]|nr:cytidine deaminase [Devosiaceae bacterium]
MSKNARPISERTMDEIDQQLLKEAKNALGLAYAPYSKFLVGAAILSDDGKTYAGCNVENAAYPLGNCAEASAISAMIMGGGKHIVRVLTVGSGNRPVTPCGGCRQRIREFATFDVPVTCVGIDGGEPLFTSIEKLLPHSFGPQFLLSE